MFLSFKQRKYSTVQRWHVSRGFFENPYRPVLTDLAEPSQTQRSLRSRIETTSEPSSKELNEGQTVPFKDLTETLKSWHGIMGKGRVK